MMIITSRRQSSLIGNLRYFGHSYEQLFILFDTFHFSVDEKNKIVINHGLKQIYILFFPKRSNMHANVQGNTMKTLELIQAEEFSERSRLPRMSCWPL